MKKITLLFILSFGLNSYCQTAGNGLIDIDGNSYNSVNIGTQEWMKENLNVSKYMDGTIIPEVTDSNEWGALTTGAWCYYDNNTVNGTIHGKLYNWYAVVGIYDSASLANPALRKQLAPTGWHVPSDDEWTLIGTALGGQSIAGGKMKVTGIGAPDNGLWISPNTDASNSSGFTGRPSGYRDPIGFYSYWGYVQRLWSSTENLDGTAFNRFLRYLNSDLNRNQGNDKRHGYSIRCLKNSGLNNNTFMGSSFKIYPNPAKDKITIDFGNQTNKSGWSYKIVNMLGQEVITGVINSQQSIVSLDSLSGKGMYFVKIYDGTNNLQETIKIIIN